MSRLGIDLKDFLVTVMKAGGDIKYARNQDNRNLILKAIFDFNNCMALVNPSNLISQGEVARAVISPTNPEEKGIEPDEKVTK